MDLLHYFAPVEPNVEYAPNQMGSKLKLMVSEEDLEEVDVVLFDVQEDRYSNNTGCAKAGNEIRKYLYQLYQGDYKLNVADIGSLKAGNRVEDTYFALEECLVYFMKKQILPVIIGGSQDLTFANYKAYVHLEQMVNLVSIDEKFALGNSDSNINSSNYMSKLLFQQPNVLFNYSNLGYQSYFVDKQELSVLDELFFDIHRLGLLKADLKLAEPIIRNADFISFNMGAVSQAFAAANANASPNGFTGEEACQLARYAGMSDKLSSIGFYEFNPSIKDGGMTAHLMAQMIWYFIDGFYNRKKDFPACNKSDYVKYTVAIDEGNQEIVFYKSPKSDRWWMEVPYAAGLTKKYERHLMLPCNYEDYLTATKNEIPERWFQTFKKLK
ncbi:MAG: arginase [Flavobacteriales bacterium]|nr:arginase [Flavobacteriales bacterium]|tara:strand:+ start:99929 stop:101077 length:1149 start_codon:yes stop_codon:yes gene_type:complete